MVIDGRAIAKEILARVREGVEGLGRTPVVRAVAVRPTPATESYLRIKAAKAEEAGMELEVVRLPEEASEEAVKAAVLKGGADAVIVQLPLPEGLYETAILDAIALSLDADVLSRAARERFASGEEGSLAPPVALAVAEILERAGIDPEGKRAVVIGAGKLVGMPVAEWLRRSGAQTTVLVEEDFSGGADALKHADIIVSGAGSPRLITPELLSEGVALIDAGTSESGGVIVGDIDPACASIASVYTPVPGGVGPVAVACLYRNVLTLIRGPVAK